MNKCILITCVLFLTACSQTISIVYTNDEHGWMEHAPQMMSHFNEPDLVLSGGDMWTGPSISTWFSGESMVDVMNAMGYDAAAIGNHEFDFGIETLIERQEQANFPFVSANVRDEQGNIPEYIPPYTILEVQGIAIGITGLTTTTTPTTTAPKNVVGLQFIDYAQALREIIPQIDADMIIVLGHICVDEMEGLALVAAELGVTLLTGGHCNERYAAVDEVALLQAGSYMQSFGRAEIVYDPLFNKVRGVTLGVFESEERQGDQAIQDIVDHWQGHVDDALGQVIGYTKTGMMRHSPEMNDLITQSWLEHYPADIVFTNTGGFRQDIPAGEITIGTIVGVMPFDNNLYELELTGEQILTFIDDFDPIMNGVDDVQPDVTYSVLTTDYLYDVYEKFQTIDPEPYDTSIHWREPVIEYIDNLASDKGQPLEGAT